MKAGQHTKVPPSPLITTQVENRSALQIRVDAAAYRQLQRTSEIKVILWF
jgi:hypothetical protein